MVKILFVCLGNICRSPTAHGVFAQTVKREGMEHCFEIESAGTAGWHIGKSPDPRSQAAANIRGYDLSYIRSRQVQPDDFEYYDYILAMDGSNLRDLEAECPPHLKHKLALFLKYSERDESEVPDPYYGGEAGFDRVLDLVEDASEGLLQHIKEKLD